MTRRRSRRQGPRSLKGTAVVLALLLVVAAAAGLPYLIASEEARRGPAEPQLTRLALPPGFSLESLESATVTDVIDGDTIVVQLRGQVATIRYFGVNTPERGERCFREATDRNELLIEEGTVLLLPDVRTTDRFGRLLRYVFLEDGTSVDATLVAEGFGLAWRDDGRYRDEIVRLEEDAKAAGRGCLW